MKRGYNVSRNGQFIEFVEGRNKQTRRSVVRRMVTHTHMGEWQRALAPMPENMRKAAYEWEYATTTGVYIRFQLSIK